MDAFTSHTASFSASQWEIGHIYGLTIIGGLIVIGGIAFLYWFTRWVDSRYVSLETVMKSVENPDIESCKQVWKLGQRPKKKQSSDEDEINQL
ncbi:hypothetical protein DTO164E3_3220 [Paecilomyces variotii]|nr:hypothetical protein DTO164E3_3220 [Paecilomyces variotii]